MGYSYEIMKKVADEYEKKREESMRKANERRAEIHLKIPEIAEIDDALSRTGLNIYAEALKGSNGIEERIEKLRLENLEMQKYRAALLKKHGYPENYTQRQYFCKKCNDSGYVGIDVCSCMKKALRTEAYLSSGLGGMLSGQSFDNFDLSYYPEEPIKGSEQSPRQMMEYILSEAKKYVENFGKAENKNLVFFGSTGLGKTHISTAIAKGVIDKGCSVIYDTAQNILYAFERERFYNKSGEDFTGKYFDCDLLIMDDLGTEVKNSFTHAMLYNILNTRICSGKAMLISTNLEDSRSLKKSYDDRITSRLIGDFRAFRFLGEDIRLKKRGKK